MLNQITSTLEAQKSFKIACLGDSITSAEWVHPNWRDVLEYVLKEELSAKVSDWRLASWGLRFINAGLDGSSTRTWLDRVEADVLKYKPDMVIVMGTLNDMDLKVPVEESTTNLSDLLSKIKSSVASIIYSTDIASNNDQYNAKYLPYLTSIKNIFPLEGITFVNMFEEFEKLHKDRFFTFESTGNPDAGIKPGELDFIHPNQLGNAYIAKILLEQSFGINFDPEKYIQENNAGRMFPKYD
jgi:lysophospholipase L1-like esterase